MKMKKIFICFRTKTQLRGVYVKSYHMVDFIRLDPAEIRRLVGKTPLAVSALVGEARTGVFVLVVCAQNRPNKGFPLQPSIVLF